MTLKSQKHNAVRIALSRGHAHSISAIVQIKHQITDIPDIIIIVMKKETYQHEQCDNAGNGKGDPIEAEWAGILQLFQDMPPFLSPDYRNSLVTSWKVMAIINSISNARPMKWIFPSVSA